MLSDKKLQFWIDKGYNVMFEGKHGVGKTSIIIDAFEKADLRMPVCNVMNLVSVYVKKVKKMILC